MDKNQKSKFPKDMSKCILKGHDAFATERGWTRFNLYIQGKKKKKNLDFPVSYPLYLIPR